MQDVDIITYREKSEKRKERKKERNKKTDKEFIMKYFLTKPKKK